MQSLALSGYTGLAKEGPKVPKETFPVVLDVVEDWFEAQVLTKVEEATSRL